MQFSVLQWNIWYEQDIDSVLEVLKANPADFICLQELTKGYLKQTKENTWEYLANSLGYDVHHVAMPVITSEASWMQANAIFSKYPIEEKYTTWLFEPESKETDRQHRAYIDSTVHIGNSDLIIGTTHLSYAPDPDSTLQPTDETVRLLEIVRSRRHSAYVLAADTNAVPSSPTTKALASLLDHAGPDYSENTWTTKPHQFADREVSTLSWRLDYIFYKNLKLLDSKAITTDVSDHLPLYATFASKE